MTPDIHFIYGQEAYFIERKLDSLLSKYIKSDSDEFNFEKYDGQNLDIGRLRSSILSMPMMSDRRVVLVRGLDKHFKGKISKERQNDWDKLIDSVPDYTVLILTANIEAKSYKSYPWSKLIKSSEASEHPRLRFEKVDKAIAAIAKSEGLEIDHEISAYLKNQYDNDFQGVELEIGRIKNYLPDRDRVSWADVSALLSMNEKYTLNSLSDKLSARDIKGFTEVIEGLIDAGTVFPVILATCKNFFVSLFRYYEAMSRFSSQGDIARETGVPPFFLKNYKTASGRYSLQDIEKILLAVADCEFRLKSLPIKDKELSALWLIPAIAGNQNRPLRKIKSLR